MHVFRTARDHADFIGIPRRFCRGLGAGCLPCSEAERRISHSADADKMSALRRGRLTARKNCQAPSARCRRYYLTNTMNALLPAGSRVAVFGTFAFQQYRPADCDQQQNS